MTSSPSNLQMKIADCRIVGSSTFVVVVADDSSKHRVGVSLAIDALSVAVLNFCQNYLGQELVQHMSTALVVPVACRRGEPPWWEPAFAPKMISGAAAWRYVCRRSTPFPLRCSRLLQHHEFRDDQ